MKKQIRGHLIQFGFQTPVLKFEDHLFGAGFGGAIINPSGQYDTAKPQYEPQADKFETQGCTVWGTENALEFLHKFLFGVEKNYEELPPYIGAGIHPDRGGDPNRVSQWIRDNGLVEAPRYPFPTTLQELLSLISKPLRSDIAKEGLLWPYKLRHQWVIEGVADKRQRIDAIKSALPYGVLGVSVTAWFQNEEGIYVDNGMRNTHWCVCYGWTDKGWKIFDSYTHEEKIYSFDSVISFAKLYFLEEKITVEQKKSLWQIISSFLFGEPEELKKLEPALNPEYVPIETKPKYLWNTPEEARHSVRVICDEMGLTLEQKNTLCATVQCESGFDIKAVNKNYTKLSNGTKVLSSTDNGICQWNDYWHGKEITTEEALNNPEKAVRLMCQYWLREQRKLWVCYSKEMYKKYL